MNKIKMLEKIRNKEDKLLVSNILDKYIKMEKTNEITVTHFINPVEMKICEEILKENYLKYIKIYAFSEAERGMLLFYPDYIDARTIKEDEYYDIVRIMPKVKNNGLKHRDYMGAIYNQGIKEDLIGDIVVYDEYAYLICDKKVYSYIEYSIKNVGKYDVTIDKVSSNVSLNKNEYNIDTVIVSAMRIDSVVSDIFNISRNETTEYIKEGKVMLNYNVCRQKDKKVSIGDTFSLRGYGKCNIKDITARTKSDRYVLLIQKYV